MPEPRYAPPAAHVEDRLLLPQASAETLKKIRNAWIAGCISTALTLVVTAVSIAGVAKLGYGKTELIDVGLMACLTFGIYKKSRICAVLMLLYFVIAKIMQAVGSGQASGMLMALVFLYYYFQGVMGTIAYHREVRA